MKFTKKFFVRLFGFLVAVFSVSSFFVACKQDDTGNAGKEATIAFERTSYELNVMQTFQVDMPIVENLEEYTLVWSSSDTSIATVNDKGYVQSEGELGKCTITAAIQGMELSSSVEVSVLYPGEVLPALTIANLDGDILNLYSGNAISLKAEVSYLGKTLNCPISYTFSNEGIVSLSENTLTAKQVGKTIVTAYTSCFDISLIQTFEVNVLPDVIALYDKTDIKLVFGEKENDTLSLTGIRLNNAVQSGNIENVVFVVENEQIVSMDEGEGRVTLTALKAGKTFVVCTYTFEDGYVCVNRIPVSVERERICFDGSLDVDLSLGDVTLDTITQGQVDEADLKSLFVGNVEMPFADGKVLGDLPLGPQTVSVYTDKQEYIFNEVFCSKIISTADDLLNLQKLGGVDTNDARRDYDYGGYFILANNIDLGKSVFTPLFTAQYGGEDPGREPDFKAGFRGVLDGRGYTVYNGVVGSGGMFGSISTYGIIKNISYVGTDLSKDSKNRLFACNNFGMLENVYVEIVLPRATYWASAEKPSVPYSGFILGYNTGSNKLTNCVFVIIPKDESVVITNENRLLSDWTNGGKCEINNVYVISEVTGNASISSNTSYCNAVYYNLSELKDHNYASDLSYFSGFDSDWVLSGEYPQRKMIELLGLTTLRVGESTSFSLETNFEPNEIVWETSNSCIRVSDVGEIEAVSEGLSVLTCKVDGIPYQIILNVISSDIAVPISSNPDFNYFYDENGTIKSIQSTTIDGKEYLTIRSGGQWYFSSSIQDVASLTNDQIVVFDIYLDFRDCNFEEVEGFNSFELYIGSSLETRKRLSVLKEGLNSGITLTADDFNDLLTGEKKLFIIDKYLVINFSKYPIDISFSDMIIADIDYKVQSPRETSIVTVSQTELGWGYTLISNDWNGIFNFSQDSEITDPSIKSILVSIKTDSDMSKTQPKVSIGGVTKTAVWEGGTWYSFTLTVEEWNKLCNYSSDDNATCLTIQQQYWSDDNKNVVGVPFELFVEMVELAYTPQSPNYETETVELIETEEYGFGYRVAVKQWNATINFTADSAITDASVESVTIYLKSEQELISELQLGVKIGSTTKVKMTEAGEWYSFTLTVDEWNKLCNYSASDKETLLTIAQTNWSTTSNMNNVAFDIVVAFNEAN